MPISITLHPVDKIPEESHSIISGLETLASLPMIKSFMSRESASDPSDLPSKETTCSLRSSYAIPLISLALNMCSLSFMHGLYLFTNIFGLYKIIYIDRI